MTQAPVLPAETLADDCYACMFTSCTSLTQAPELPAEILTKGCYNSMFDSCKLLSFAPELPATTLARDCYDYMFSECTEFSEVHMKSSMEGVYNTSTHGDVKKTVIYDL